MKRGTPRHPKIYDLMQALDLTPRQRAIAIGTLELLWHFAAEFAPQGDIGKYSDARIEAAVDWSGKKGILVPALITSKWCDASDQYRVLVHDWHDHADDATKKRLTRSGLMFLSVNVESTGQRQKSSATQEENGGPPLPLPLPLPEPQPVPEPVPEPKPLTAPIKRKPGSPSYEELNAGWKWYQAQYPREVHPHMELRLFMSVMETPEDLADLYANLPLYMESRQWVEGFAPSSENFLSKRMFKTRPKQDPIPVPDSNQQRHGQVINVMKALNQARKA